MKISSRDQVRACSADRRVWPLHVVWHFLSCASAYYGLLSDMASRIDCGLSSAPEALAGGVVPLHWAGVPFTEVRVTCAGTHGKKMSAAPFFGRTDIRKYGKCVAPPISTSLR